MTSIQAKIDLADDRPLLLLGKAVSKFLTTNAGSEASELVAVAKESIQNYELRELEVWETQMKGIVSELARITDEIQNSQSAFGDSEYDQSILREKVNTAYKGKRARVEFNSVASQINELPSRTQSEQQVVELEQIIATLQSQNDHQLRIVEYRRQQMEPIIFWANILRTGSIPS